MSLVGATYQAIAPPGDAPVYLVWEKGGEVVGCMPGLLRRFPEPHETQEALALMETERKTCDINVG